MAGLIAELENGLMAIELGFNGGFGFCDRGVGQSGRTAESLEVSEATVLAAVGESVAAGLAASEFGSHIGEEHGQ